MVYDKPEPIENLITWVYEEGNFVPSAKIIGEEKFSIVNDYIGRPVQVYSEAGELVWETDYDIYGGLKDLKGDRGFMPYRQAGQYKDVETNLYYNRFRYYNSDTGMYLNQDPIGIEGSNPNFYAYVHDSNSWVDIFGLDPGKAIINQFKNGHPEGHYTIEIQTQRGSSLTTHQVITSENHSTTKITNNTNGLGSNPYELVQTSTINLADADAAMKYQKESVKISDLGKYDAINNSCLSHVTDVLENGGEAPVSKTRLGYAKFLRRNGFNLIKCK
ncbi:RHS repeat-associated core domain-containing protein [Flavobacterium sp. LS1R47]|uniref:RHS repeat-associated core domain-containing protein n=1 Tax=Flavobacterium frigoritolerans TaxID=2987686 RepID=A0A9X2ZRW4_9FLAO|nr:RHS repeat-associated core domain-containing protein [Flavobacterium frigoritolerans]MCV9933722.1 RHS repeat-associated core domain-containing protein [Flavobacterium frigoritolerans]